MAMQDVCHAINFVLPQIIYYLINKFPEFFLQLDLIKVIASQRPGITATSIVQRINIVFGDANEATKSSQVGYITYIYLRHQFNGVLQFC